MSSGLIMCSAMSPAVYAGLVDDGGAGLPPGAIAYADFKNGTYYYGGNALSDFLVENTDWSDFDTAKVQAGVGLADVELDGTAAPVVAAPLTAELLASGFSAVMVYTKLASPETQVLFFDILDLPGYSAEWVFNFVQSSDENDGSFNNNYLNTEVLDATQPDGTNKAGMTLEADSDIIMVINAGTALSYTPATATPDSIAISVKGAVVLEQVTFYPPKSAAELQALTA